MSVRWKKKFLQIYQVLPGKIFYDRKKPGSVKLYDK